MPQEKSVLMWDKNADRVNHRVKFRIAKKNRLDIPLDGAENIGPKEARGMKIKFSRHAKRRASLYKIPESTISAILMNIKLKQGRNEIIRDVPGLQYPLKIIVSVAGGTATVITNYPVKKGRKT